MPELDRGSIPEVWAKSVLTDVRRAGFWDRAEFRAKGIPLTRRRRFRIWRRSLSFVVRRWVADKVYPEGIDYGD